MKMKFILTPKIRFFFASCQRQCPRRDEHDEMQFYGRDSNEIGRKCNNAKSSSSSLKCRRQRISSPVEKYCICQQKIASRKIWLPFNHQCFARSQTSQVSWMRSESWIASRPPFLILPTWSPTTSGWKWLSNEIEFDLNSYSISISRRQLLLVDIQSEQSASLLLYGAFKQLFNLLARFASTLHEKHRTSNVVDSS